MTKHDLHKAWLTHPHVVAFDKAVRAHIKAHGLTGLDGINAVLKFAAAWQDQHGLLPDSGIKCG